MASAIVAVKGTEAERLAAVIEVGAVHAFAESPADVSRSADTGRQLQYHRAWRRTDKIGKDTNFRGLTV